RREYMTLEMELMEQRKYGEKLGRIEGEKSGRIEGEQIAERNMSTLIKRLTEDNRLDDIKRMAEDGEYLKKLYREYGIQNWLEE
ncbi:MAG: hypothetical protein K6G85_03310, partial [Eubacterium sp.]|nr:hypothetical protein [Eubacterium sp.]